MTKLIAHIILTSNEHADDAEAALRDGLSKLPGVTVTTIRTEQPRLGLTEMLAIAELIEKSIDVVRWLIEHKRAHADIAEIEIEIKGRRVPVAEVTEQHLTGPTRELQPHASPKSVE